MLIFIIHVFIYLPLSMWTGFKLGRLLRKQREEGLSQDDVDDWRIHLIGYAVVAGIVVGHDVSLFL